MCYRSRCFASILRTATAVVALGSQTRRYPASPAGLKRHSVTLFEGGRVAGEEVVKEMISELWASYAAGESEGGGRAGDVPKGHIRTPNGPCSSSPLWALPPGLPESHSHSHNLPSPTPAPPLPLPPNNASARAAGQAFEGDLLRLTHYCAALATLLEAVRASAGPGVPLELLRKESLAGLAPGAAAKVGGQALQLLSEWGWKAWHAVLPVGLAGASPREAAPLHLRHTGDPRPPGTTIRLTPAYLPPLPSSSIMHTSHLHPATTWLATPRHHLTNSRLPPTTPPARFRRHVAAGAAPRLLRRGAHHATAAARAAAVTLRLRRRQRSRVGRHRHPRRQLRPRLLRPHAGGGVALAAAGTLPDGAVGFEGFIYLRGGDRHVAHEQRIWKASDSALILRRRGLRCVLVCRLWRPLATARPARAVPPARSCGPQSMVFVCGQRVWRLPHPLDRCTHALLTAWEEEGAEGTHGAGGGSSSRARAHGSDGGVSGRSPQETCCRHGNGIARALIRWQHLGSDPHPTPSSHALTLARCLLGVPGAHSSHTFPPSRGYLHRQRWWRLPSCCTR